MGRIRPTYIKRIARELIEKYPNEFTAEFEHNKHKVFELCEIQTKTLRNRIAGYITRLEKRKRD